jgi:hypothetical protein
MKFIAKVVFKIHRKVFGYPARSEVRLAVEFQDTYTLGLTSAVGMLYICGETPDSVSSWLGVEREVVVDILNKLADGSSL